ncbi:MAG: Spx/MgsR family RNA polymerase-binding regulatory protein [Sphingobacteriaceae bacterium]
MKVYGIKNCNTVKKAFDWLNNRNIPFEFHDFKKEGITGEKLNTWNDKAGYIKFLNKQGLTWKQLDAKLKADIKSSEKALQLLEQKNSMIKRPVIEDGDFLFFGFDDAVYTEHFLKT